MMMKMVNMAALLTTIRRYFHLSPKRTQFLNVESIGNSSSTQPGCTAALTGVRWEKLLRRTNSHFKMSKYISDGIPFICGGDKVNEVRFGYNFGFKYPLLMK